MYWWEVLIATAVALFALTVIAVSAIRKKRGKGSCCAQCACCPYRKDCDGEKHKTSVRNN